MTEEGMMSRSLRSSILALLTILHIGGPAFAVRQATISSFVNVGSPAAVAWFGGTFIYSGGVSPGSRGVRFFIDNNNQMVQIDSLNIVFQNNPGSPVQISLNNDRYELPIPLGMVCPLAQFVNRNGSIIFTIPSKEDPSFFNANRLVQYEDTNAYVAAEFSGTRFAKFFEDLDLADITVKMPNNMRLALMREINNANAIPSSTKIDPSDWESYVNADFHVTYSAYLQNFQNRKRVDIAGLPLRYYWSPQRSGKALINDVEVFDFPTTETGLLYDAVIFFQNTAVFRQFRKDRADNFRAFSEAACSPTRRR
jgi:hypothetical protein